MCSETFKIIGVLACIRTLMSSRYRETGLLIRIGSLTSTGSFLFNLNCTKRYIFVWALYDPKINLLREWILKLVLYSVLMGKLSSILAGSSKLRTSTSTFYCQIIYYHNIRWGRGVHIDKITSELCQKKKNLPNWPKNLQICPKNSVVVKGLFYPTNDRLDASRLADENNSRYLSKRGCGKTCSQQVFRNSQVYILQV